MLTCGDVWWLWRWQGAGLDSYGREALGADAVARCYGRVAHSRLQVPSLLAFTRTKVHILTQQALLQLARVG